jgi:hypothetical protein
VLSDAVRRTGPYEGAGDNPIARVQGCDIRVAGNSFFIPRPVDEDHNAFHGISSRPNLKRPNISHGQNLTAKSKQLLRKVLKGVTILAGAIGPPRL